MDVLRKGIIFMAACVLWVSAAVARDAIEIESRYTGDGWFEYRIRTLDDPFIGLIYFGQLAPNGFTNHIDTILPPGWTNAVFNGHWSGIKSDGSVTQTRVQEITFSAQSTARHFRQATFTCIVGIHLSDVLGDYFGGYVNLNCLVPCAPEHADGSPATFLSQIELVPDIKIDELIVTNSQVHGLTFSWYQDSTVQLEGSPDMVDWTPITRFWGNPPQTTWTTNTPLNSFGDFFRLSLVANSHLESTNVLSMLAASAQPARVIPISSQEMIGNRIKLGFASVPGAVYEVEHHERPGLKLTTRRIVATGHFTNADVDISESKAIGIFKVREIAE